MAVAFVRNHTAQSVKAAGTNNFDIAISATVAAGNVLIARILFDNAATTLKPEVVSIAKPASETASWVRLGFARSASTSAGAFASGEIWAITTTVSWPTAFHIVTLDTSAVMKATYVAEFAGATATLRNTVGTAYSTSTTAASATTIGTTPVIGDLALGFIFGSNVAAAQTGDNDTTGGTWSTPIGVGSIGSGAATNNFGVGQYKILTTASHQTLNNSATMTAGNGAIVAILQQALPPPIPVNASDSIVITDIFNVQQERNFTDIASMLRDGGGRNLLGIESSFETDTDTDGIADGWRVPTGSELGSNQVPDATSLVPVMAGGHGTQTQRITRISGSNAAALYGPLVPVVPGALIQIWVRAYNEGIGSVTANVGLSYYTSDLVWLSNTETSLVVSAGQNNGNVGHTNLVPTNAAYCRPTIGVNFVSTGSLNFDQVRVSDGTQIFTYDYFDPANRIVLILPLPMDDSIGITDSITISLSRSDSIDITDSISAAIVIPPVVLPLADSLGLTDSVIASKTINRNFIDLASMLRDGGGVNLLGIESSFESDTNADGVADGWRVQAGESNIQTPDAVALVSVIPGGHGSQSQSVTKSAGSNAATLFGPRYSIIQDTSLSMSVRVRNPGASSVDYYIGVFVYNSGDSPIAGKGIVQASVPAGSSVTVLQNSGKFSNPAQVYWRPVIGLTNLSSGTLIFDSVTIHDGIVSPTFYDYVDPANRIVLTPAGLDLPLADSIGVTDSITTLTSGLIPLPLADMVGLTDAVSTVLSKDISLFDTVGLTDSINLSRFLTYALESIGLIDGRTVIVNLSRSDNIGATDNRSLTSDRARTDNLNLTDSRTSVTALSQSDTVALVDVQTSIASLTRNDNVSLTDTVHIGVTSAWLHDVTDNIGLADVGTLTTALIYDDNISLIDTLNVSTTSEGAYSATDVIELVDTRTFDASLIRVDSISLTDTSSIGTTTDWTYDVTDTVGLVDARTFAAALACTDIAGLVDIRTLTTGLTRADSTALTDVSASSVVKVLIDLLGSSDLVSPMWSGVVGGRPEVWSGSEWITKPVKVWNGSAWAEKPMKYQNAEAVWELV